MTDPARTTKDEWRMLFSMEIRQGQEIQVLVRGVIDPAMLDAWQFAIDIIKASIPRHEDQDLPAQEGSST